ncbi:MAG: DNA alkylation repair protein [Thermoplasmata archaeon]|nr:DNA alkylation repair protein [Thermoplasmata archaeon]
MTEGKRPAHAPPRARRSGAGAAWDQDLRDMERRLRSMASPRRAAAAKAYLKSSLTFFGNSVPELRRATQRLVRQHREATREQLRAVVDGLWSGRVYERWTVGVLLLESYPHTLDRRDLPFVRRLILRGHWWNYVDDLAVHVAGPIVERDAVACRTMERWSRDPDLWVRRGGLLALHPGLKRGTIPFRLFDRVAVPRLSERDFFMRKALGWILREAGKHDPAPVAAFLRRHSDVVSPLTRREAIKYLPARLRRGL